MQYLTLFFVVATLLYGHIHGHPIHQLGVMPKMNLVCVITNCLEQAGACAANAECRKSLECASNCLKLWDNDTTPEKYHVQNCSNICVFSYREKVYEDFMACMTGHKCMSFPPIPSRCRAPGNLTMQKNVTIKDVAGYWWVVKGYHPVYDCYPCQHLHITQVNSTTWNYLPIYQVYLANGSLGLVHDTFDWNIPDPTAPNFSFVYHDAGLVHYESWWLFDAADDFSYVLMYYCGNTLEWYYDGALVLAREPSLSTADYSKIAASYSKAIGLDTAKFCSTKTKQCPDEN